MYNDEIKQKILTNLEDKELSIVNNTIYLCSQGYVVNQNKHTKLAWTSILIDAFENINIFNEEQQASIERLYNKIVNV